MRKISRFRLYFSGVLILFSLVLTGAVHAQTATPGAESPEKLGSEVFEAVKTKSLDGYMNFIRTVEDEKEIIANLPVEDEAKSSAMVNMEEDRQQFPFLAQDGFKGVLDSLEEKSIKPQSIVFKKVILDKEYVVDEIKHGEYNIVFSDGNRDYYITMSSVVQAKRGYVFKNIYSSVEPFSGKDAGTLGALIRDIIKSDICKGYVVNIKGVRAAMKLTGEENSPEGLSVINEQRALATADVMLTLHQFGRLKEENREQVQRLVMKMLDEECAE